MFFQIYFTIEIKTEMSGVDLGTSMQQGDLEESLVNEHLNNSNTEGLRKIIYRYQGKIKDLLKINSKQKKNNEQLKAELKQLNETLNQLINKVAVKSKHEKQQNTKDEVLKKEIENQMRKNNVLRKEIEALKVKMKVYQSQKLGDLHDQIRQKNRVIEDLHQSLKLHERIEKKEMTMDIYKRQEEAQKKIKILTEQVGHIKKKMQDQRKMHDIQQRSILLQQRKMNELQTIQKSRQKDPKNDSTGPKETYKLLEQENLSLKEQLQGQQKSRKIQQKSLRVELDQLRSKLKSTQKSNSELKDLLAQKQKEVLSLYQRVKMLQKQGASISERSIQSEQKLPSWLQLNNCRRQLKGATNIRSAAQKFDDASQLSQDKQFKIRTLCFKYFEQHILELNITYDIGQSKKDRFQQIKTAFSIKSPYQSIKEQTLQMNEFEYITDWQIFLGKGIQFMRIKTSKEQLLEIGNQRNSLKCKRLPFNIKSFQKPVSVFGITEIRSFGERQRQVLVAFGLVLKRKNIFGGRAQSLARLQKNSMSLVSKNNDKNIE